MIRWAFIAAGVSGVLAVAIGAFGAHALRDALDPRMQAVFGTANRYHFFHTLALLAVALAPAMGHLPRRLLALVCAAWLGGIVVFSGSLYTLAVTGAGWLGAITPIGGAAFLLGWAVLVVAGARAIDRPG